jgi:hypothetical protein
MQQVENPMPTAVISTDAACVDNSILVDYWTSEVALEEPEIRSPDEDIPIHNNSTDDELHDRIPGGWKDYDNPGDEIDESDAIPTTSRQRRAASDLESFDLGTSHVDRYEGNDGDNVQVDEVEEASHPDDGLPQTLED